LNPQYKLHHVPGPNKDGKVYSFVIPKAAMPAYVAFSDTLYATTAHRLAKAPLPPPTQVASGSSGSSTKYHTVRSGDTLGAIAKKYGVRVSDIQRWNGMRGTTIRIGQKLKVKG
jgi:membrane-bound lytic murein transglycosylase D